MKYLFLLLILAGCSAPRAETKEDNQVLNPSLDLISQTQAVTDSEPLSGEALEAQITEDFKPYLKYLSREKLYPHIYVKNGFVLLDAENRTNLINFKNNGAVLTYTNQYGIVFYNTDDVLIKPDEWGILSQQQPFRYSYHYIFYNLTNVDIQEAFIELVLKEFPFDPPQGIFHSKTAALLNIPSTFMSQMGLSFYLELTVERIAELSGIPDKELYILFGLEQNSGTPLIQAQKAFYLFQVLCRDTDTKSIRAFILNRMASMVYLNNAAVPQISFPPLRWQD